jgi:aldehyde:ferredoxin oxidoreductase
MARVAFASATRQSSTIVVKDWPLADAPLHLCLAHHLVRRDTQPFVIISRGQVAGRPVVGAQVISITSVSPQSGGIAEAKVEGSSAQALFRLDLDALVISGIAPETAGLEITGPSDDLTLRWEPSQVPPGATVWEVDSHLRSSAQDVIITTGRLGMASHPAASIVANNGFPTTQGGLGAVLGLLNLKYIRVHQLGAPANPSELERQVTAEYDRAIDTNPLTKSEKDLPGFAVWPSADLLGYAGSDGFSGRMGVGLASFSGEKFLPYVVDDGELACPHCPQACLKSFSADSTTPRDGGRAHQLGMSARASQSNETDAAEIVAFNAACHELGVEHLCADEALRLSTGVTGMKLTEAIEKALQEYPEGVGASLRVKGMALAPFDPRANQGLAIGLALNPTGPRYDVLEHDIDFEAGAPWMTKEGLESDFGVNPEGLPMGTLDERRYESIVALWLIWSAFDVLGVCEYAAPPTRELTIPSICSLVASTTGQDFDSEDLRKVGRLRLGILRDINSALGLTESMDTLPDYFFQSALPEGPLAGVALDAEEFRAASDFVRHQFNWSLDGVAEGSVMRGQIDEVIAQADNLLEGVLL